MSRDAYNRLTLLAIVVLIVLMVVGLTGMGNAQELTTTDPAVVVVGEATTFEQWLDAMFKVLLAGIGLFLSFAIKTGVDSMARMLPPAIGELVNAWIDAKRQKDLHSAIMSSVSTIIREGRWTGNAIDSILEIKRNIVASTKQAADHNGIAVTPQPELDKVLANIANAKATEVQEKIADTLAKVAVATGEAARSNSPVNDELMSNVGQIFGSIRR